MSNDFYLSKQGVKEYLQLSSDSDSSFIVAKFKNYLNDGDQILELGSGPGRDLFQLENVIYSDFSPLFIELLKKKFPDNKILKIDAVSIQSDEVINAFYSNKVLHHLSDDELKQSFSRQNELLQKGGIICHTFWAGNKSEEFKGLLFNHHTSDELNKWLSKTFDILVLEEYEEFVPGDSLLLIARKKN